MAPFPDHYLLVPIYIDVHRTTEYCNRYGPGNVLHVYCVEARKMTCAYILVSSESLESIVILKTDRYRIKLPQPVSPMKRIPH